MEKPRKRRASRTNRITLDDVARHVGVSAITVSRALRSPQKVAPALRDQILEAAQTLGYVPSLSHRLRICCSSI
jgi:LacI family gluconate utilization system Gnt-I transcriptional repressor